MLFSRDDFIVTRGKELRIQILAPAKEKHAKCSFFVCKSATIDENK